MPTLSSLCTESAAQGGPGELALWVGNPQTSENALQATGNRILGYRFEGLGAISGFVQSASLKAPNAVFTTTTPKPDNGRFLIFAERASNPVAFTANEALTSRSRTRAFTTLNLFHESSAPTSYDVSAVIQELIDVGVATDSIVLIVVTKGGSGGIRFGSPVPANLELEIEYDVSPPAPPTVPDGVLISHVHVDVLWAQRDLISPSAVPAKPSDWLLPNWAEEIEVETEFRTDVYESQSLAESRRGLRSIPLRTIRCSMAAYCEGDAARLAAAINRVSEGRQFFPLFCDSTIATANLAAADPELYTKRFFPGQRVIIYSNHSDDAREIRQLTFKEIASTGIYFLAGQAEAGDLIVPLIEVRPSLTQILEGNTDLVFQAELELVEYPGPTALPVQASLSPWVSFLPTHDSLPVLTLSPDWASSPEVSVVRGGEELALGRSSLVSLRGSRPTWRFRFQYGGFDRVEMLRGRLFFESRLGRLLPFWLPNPLTLFRYDSHTTTSVNIEKDAALGEVSDLFPTIAIETKSSVYLRSVSSVVDNGSVWALNFLDALPSIPSSDIVRVTSAHLCRFESDSLVEQWTTDRVGSMEFVALELLAEGPVQVPVL